MSAFSFTAPFISEEQFRKETEDFTEEERLSIKRDVYGVDYDEPPEYNQQLHEESLEHFNDAMDAIDNSDKEAYLQALETHPKLVERESNPIDYLRGMRWDASTAAARVASYWRFRKQLFGEETFLLPMTLQRAMQPEQDALKAGTHFILPDDVHGRAVLYFDRIKGTRNSMSRESLMRIYFYHLQVIAERREIHGKGYVQIINFKGYDLYKHHDRTAMKQAMAIIHVFPMPWRANHMCTGSGKSVVGIVLPVAQQLGGKGKSDLIMRQCR